MKKLFSILTLLFFGAVIVGFFSCDGGTDPNNPASQQPTLTVTGVSASPVEAAPGEVLNFHIVAQSNANSNKDLETLTFKAVMSPGGTLLDSNLVIGSTEKKYCVRDVDFTVPTNATDGSAITITMKLTDKASESKTVTWVINVKININVYTYTDVTLGSYNNTTLGSFYAATSNYNLVYKIADAKTNCTKVDMCYYYGTTNAATLAAPNDPAAATLFNSPTYGLATWPIKNATTFRKIAVLTTTEFDALDATTLQNKYTTAPGGIMTYSNTLSDGSGGMQQSFVAFKTANPVKHGVIKVTEIDVVNQAAGYIKFTVKIEK